MSLFGYTLIKKDSLNNLEIFAVRQQKLNQVKDWFSGWKDLDIIWKYIYSDIYFGGIDSCREEYALKRGTNCYGQAVASNAEVRIRELEAEVENLKRTLAEHVLVPPTTMKISLSQTTNA